MRPTDGSVEKLTLVLVYEEKQVPQIERVLAGKDAAHIKVVALDLWAAEALRARNIPHHQLDEYVPPFQHDRDAFASVNAVAREWYRIPAMSFFSHQGVALAESVEIAIQSYLGKVWNARDVIRRVVAANRECAHIVIPHAVEPVGPFGTVTALFEACAFTQAADLIASERHISIETIGVPPTRPPGLFESPPFMRTLVLKIYNACMSLLPRRPLKAFASDYWRYLSPYVEKMPDLEVALMDRGEVRSMSWKTLLLHRVRVMHPHDYVTPAMHHIARDRVGYFREQWKDARAQVAQRYSALIKADIPWETVEPAFSYLVETYSERIILDIESTRSIFKSQRITRVLLRASVSAQHHFFVLAQVAYTLGIPAIEVQHGIETQAPHSLYSRLKSAYLAAYGICMQERMCRDHGYAPQRIRAIGSPRLDRYQLQRLSVDERARRLKEYGLDPARPVVVCGVSGEGWYLYPSYFTSFEIGESIEAMRHLKDQVPELQFIFKFREGRFSGPRLLFMRRMFPADAFCTDTEDLQKLFLVSDILVTPRSTLMYEATLQGLPVLVYPVRAGDASFVSFYEPGFSILTSSDAFLKYTPRMLADADGASDLHEHTSAFLAREYSFDGYAGERMVAFLRENLKPLPASDVR